MDLYTYFRSAAAYRVRIALNLKGIHYRAIPVALTKNGGEQHTPAFRSLNPQGLVPVLVDQEFALSQSLAIIEYLEERFPDPPLQPADAEGRARARQFAQIIAADIHPLTNIRVLRYLKDVLHVSELQRRTWYQHWILEGFDAIELWLTAERPAGPYCLGRSISLADICLIPQMYNARRVKLPLDDFPTLCEIDENCQRLDAFRRAAPSQQPDAPAA